MFSYQKTPVCDARIEPRIIAEFVTIHAAIDVLGAKLVKTVQASGSNQLHQILYHRFVIFRDSDRVVLYIQRLVSSRIPRGDTRWTSILITLARFTDEFLGQRFDVTYDIKNQTGRIADTDGKELTTLLVFWFAWYAFHPDTEIYTAN